MQSIKSVTYDVHTHNHTRMRQKKQGRGFPIIITGLNANDPTA